MQGRWVGGEFVYVTDAKADSLSGNLARAGDLIFTQRGTLGQVALVPKQGAGKYLVSQSQMKATIDPSKADAVFLYYFFSSAAQQEWIRCNAIQTGVPHTNLGILKKHLVLLPPLAEQRMIASVLSSLDDKIEQNRRTGRALEALARATFKAWFVDFEPVKAKAAGAAGFPGMPPAAFADLPYRLIESPFGAVPEGWAVGTMGDLLKERGERVTPGNETRRLPYVPIDCITSRRVTLETFKSGEEAQSSLIRFQDGDILFGAMRPYFHKVCLAPFSGTTRTTCFVLVPRTDSDRAFALMLASEPATVQFATTHSVGSTIPYAKWQSSLHEMPCFLPPEALRAAFGMFVDSLLHLSNQTVHESAKLATLRDYLLPRLLSGEVRVVQPQSEEKPS